MRQTRSLEASIPPSSACKEDVCGKTERRGALKEKQIVDICVTCFLLKHTNFLLLQSTHPPTPKFYQCKSFDTCGSVPTYQDVLISNLLLWDYFRIMILFDTQLN